MVTLKELHRYSVNTDRNCLKSFLYNLQIQLTIMDFTQYEQIFLQPEHRRINAFELWCWRRILRVPWTARRSNQSILKISPGCSLERLMLKLKLQYFGHLMRGADSLEKTDAGRNWGQEEKGTTDDEMVGQHDQLNGHEFE